MSIKLIFSWMLHLSSYLYNYIGLGNLADSFKIVSYGTEQRLFGMITHLSGDSQKTPALFIANPNEEQKKNTILSA